MLQSAARYGLLLSAEGKLIVRGAGSEGGRKIPPKTVLYTTNQGTVDEPKSSSEPQFPWKFSKAKDLVVDGRNAADLKVTTIGTMAHQRAADQLFAHTPFTRGVAPPAFTPKKTMCFLPKDAQVYEKLAAAVKGSSRAALVWVAGLQGSKVILNRLAIVTTKQVVVKAGHDEMV